MAVADAESCEINLLNSSASLVWLTLLDRDCTETDLCALFDEVAQPVLGRQDEAILSILRNFESLGWAHRTSDATWRISDSCAPTMLWTQSACYRSGPFDKLWRRKVRVADASLLLQVQTQSGSDSNGDFARLSHFLGGLPLDREPQPDAVLSLAITADGIEIRDGDKTSCFKDVHTASGPFLRLAINHLYPDARALTTLHAGAVCGPRGALLFPAISGSGKTTLTAYLSAHGWRYGGDDVVGIGRLGASNEIQLLPFPTALGIKEGSFDILRPFYPDLTEVTPVVYGAKAVRFVACDGASIDSDWRKVRALVFPTFDKDSSLQLDALSQVDALRLVLDAGWGDGVELDPAGFALLLAAVNDLPRYSLRYSSLEAAAAALESLP